MGFQITDLMLAAFFIFGLNAITREDKILGALSKLTTFRGANTFSLANILTECCTCMSSLYGSAFYFYLLGIEPKYNSTTSFLVTGAVMFSLVEIGSLYWITALEARRPVSDTPKETKKEKAFVLVLNKVSARVSLAAYSASIGYTIYTYQYYDYLVFIVGLAGLCALFESGVCAAKAMYQTASNIEAHSQLTIRCTEEILEAFKNK